MVRRLVPRPLLALLSFLLPLAAALLRPFGLGLEPALLLGVLGQVLFAWISGFSHRNVASLWLLAAFLTLGEARPSEVLNFPLSGNFVLIVAAFLVSEAISKSGLSERLVKLVFGRFTGSPRGLVRFAFVAGAALALFVPQPFPRVIVMSSLFATFLAEKELADTHRRACLLAVFAATTGTSMLLKGGDVLLNNAALALAGGSVSYLRWAVLMFVPSLAISVISYLALVWVFRVPSTPFKALDVPGASERAARQPNEANPRSRIAVVSVVVAALVAAWVTEPLHGLSAAASAAIAVAVLLAFRALSFRDVRVIDPSLLIFLTAAFSIGKTLAANGIAQRVAELVGRALPAASSPWYFLAMALLVMVLHFVIGSVLTTMSIAIPSLVAATAGAMPAELVGLFAYSVITMQYFLPIHHVTVLIGAGKGYYTQKDTIAFGAAMAMVVPLYAALILVPWWRLVGAF